MDRLANILETPMDRKDFLRHMGLGAMVLVGSNLIIRTIFGQQKSQPKGYGSSAYGGAKR